MVTLLLAVSFLALRKRRPSLVRRAAYPPVLLRWAAYLVMCIVEQSLGFGLLCIWRKNMFSTRNAQIRKTGFRPLEKHNLLFGRKMKRDKIVRENNIDLRKDPQDAENETED